MLDEGRISLAWGGNSKSENIGTAYAELSVKFGSWSPLFYRELPFIFGYTTGGTSIEFCLITRTGQFLRLDNHCYDATISSNRLSIVGTTIKILRCMRMFQLLLPENPVMQPYSRPNGLKVIIRPMMVINQIPLMEMSEDLKESPII